MLALTATFFPVKAAVLYWAYPMKMANPDKGWRAVMGAVYVVLMGLVALVPAYVFGWIVAPGDSGLSSINKRTSLLCQGGIPAFLAGAAQSSFCLLGAYFAVAIFVNLFGNAVSSLRANWERELSRPKQ